MNTDYQSRALTQNFKEKIYKKYNIFGIAEHKQIDVDFDKFERHLRTLKKDVFLPNEKFIVEWFDVDFYFEDFDYGLNLYNLINCFKNADVPLFCLLLLSNHIGISKEVEKLAHDPHDKPTVIEMLCTTRHWSDSYKNIELGADKIEKHGICMLGQDRVHRNATFRMLEENNLLDKVASAAGPSK